MEADRKARYIIADHRDDILQFKVSGSYFVKLYLPLKSPGSQGYRKIRVDASKTQAVKAWCREFIPEA